MARLSLDEMFGNVRGYLDTDALNFPSDLLNMLMQRLWFQAVTMERGWRFFQRRGTTPVAAGTSLVPFTFDTLPAGATPATRLMAVWFNGKPLVWQEASMAMRTFGDLTGSPVIYSEVNDGIQRNIGLYPAAGYDGELEAEFYAEPVYPVVLPSSDPNAFAVIFADLPAEFDAALQEGLLAEMYMREEDTDLYDMHRQMFLEQMGSIRNRWKESMATPLVMAGEARDRRHDHSGFSVDGSFRQPAAP